MVEEILFAEKNTLDYDYLDLLHLRTVFNNLPEINKIVLGLRLEGYTQSEISKLACISRTSVWAIQKQTILLLREAHA